MTRAALAFIAIMLTGCEFGPHISAEQKAGLFGCGVLALGVFGFVYVILKGDEQ